MRQPHRWSDRRCSSDESVRTAGGNVGNFAARRGDRCSEAVNYGLFVVFLTPMFMLMSDFIHPAEGLIVARLTNEFVGACVGVAASFLFWPPKASDALNAAISAALSANMAFASAALRMTGESTAMLDSLQREAGLASSRLEAARERMLLEGQRRSARLEQLRNLTVAVRVVRGAAAVIEVLRRGEPDADDRERANRYDELTAGLLKSLASKEAMRLTQPLGAPADELDQAIQQLVAAFDHYMRPYKSAPRQVERYSTPKLAKCDRRTVRNVLTRSATGLHPHRLIDMDSTALAAHSPATIGKMIAVFPVESMMRPITGSPMPAKI